MIVEESRLEQQQQITSLCQVTLLRHQCNDQCQQFYDTLQLTQRIFVKLKVEIQTDIYIEEALNIIEQRISLRKNDKYQKEKLKKQKQDLSLPVSLTQKLQDIANKLENQISPQFLAGYLSISKNRAQHLQRIILYSDFKEQTQQFNFTYQHSQWLSDFVVQDNLQSLYNSATIYKRFKEKFDINNNELQLHQFKQWMKSQNIYTYRLTSRVNFRSQKNTTTDSRVEFAKKIAQLFKQKVTLIYIDEANFGRNLKAPKCWQKKNKHQLLSQLSSSNKLKTVIGAISEDGFLAFKCVIGYVNQFVFAEFLSELLSLLHHTRVENDYCLILDNATIHKTERIQKILNLCNHVFLPPYSPQLNCIEHLWAQVKLQLSRKQGSLISQEFHQIHLILNNITVNEVKSTCQSNLMYLRACIQREEF